jgi:hypothetical protein
VPDWPLRPQLPPPKLLTSLPSRSGTVVGMEGMEGMVDMAAAEDTATVDTVAA